MVGHLFQNYDTIYARFFLTYSCNHSCNMIYVRFFVTYTCVFLLCGYKRAYTCAQKSPYICVTNKHVVFGVTCNHSCYKQACGIWGHRKWSYTEESPNYTVSKKTLHVRWSWKVTLVWINHGCNGRVNFKQGLVLTHCPHSSDGCWLPDNELVGIRGLSLERLCTLFHECWPKQWSIQLKISVWQAKRNS